MFASSNIIPSLAGVSECDEDIRKVCEGGIGRKCSLYYLNNSMLCAEYTGGKCML